jgi:hypothetical protein
LSFFLFDPLGGFFLVVGVGLELTIFCRDGRNEGVGGERWCVVVGLLAAMVIAEVLGFDLIYFVDGDSWDPTVVDNAAVEVEAWAGVAGSSTKEDFSLWLVAEAVPLSSALVASMDV